MGERSKFNVAGIALEVTVQNLGDDQPLPVRLIRTIWPDRRRYVNVINSEWAYRKRRQHQEDIISCPDIESSARRPLTIFVHEIVLIVHHITAVIRLDGRVLLVIVGGSSAITTSATSLPCFAHFILSRSHTPELACHNSCDGSDFNWQYKM